ncbi:hypothetical protein BC940DRAFT_237606 [Gongronella butleri]|nr:hypothetical protein BC940DRAFT_237606 [Gongronella butleri]
MQPSFTSVPATCELCGQWLPNHKTSCPRNGVHPSQWTLHAEPLEQPFPAQMEDTSDDELD